MPTCPEASFEDLYSDDYLSALHMLVFWALCLPSLAHWPDPQPTELTGPNAGGLTPLQTWIVLGNL